jgi:hypothetical protein
VAIQVQIVYNELVSLLDAEGSSYYEVDQDYIPAINRGQKYVCSIINSILGGKKFAEEHYRELIKNQIFQTSQYSRIDLTPANGDVVWDILNIVVNPVLNIPFVASVVPNNLSKPRPDLFYVNGGSSCERMTVAEWTQNADNPFRGGYDKEPKGQNLKYAYLQYVDYFNGLFNVPNEIEVRPVVPIQPVAVYFAKMPNEVAALTDMLEWPDTFQDILVKAAFREIAIKQGDQTTAFTVASQDIMTYVKSLA